jgi:hypothetical protein
MAQQKISFYLDEASRFNLSTSPIIAALLTLHNCCRDYRDAGGFKWNNSTFPELRGCSIYGQACSLKVFHTVPGVMSYDTMVCFPITEHRSMNDFVNGIIGSLTLPISTGRLWTSVNMEVYTRSQTREWTVRGMPAEMSDSSMLEGLPRCKCPVLATYSVHANLEAEHLPMNSTNKPTRHTTVTLASSTPRLRVNVEIDLAIGGRCTKLASTFLLPMKDRKSST